MSNSVIYKRVPCFLPNILFLERGMGMRSAWDWFRYLETEPTARSFLAEAYKAAGKENPQRLAFQQSTRFLYTWKQARAYYDAASGSDLLIRPLLLFYGCVHLLKGLFICIDPDYPQSSRMLQHGVTTRKLKRTPYQLLADEVRPQKEGFFAHLVSVLGLSPLQDRYQVGQLFSFLPELDQEYALLAGERHWTPVSFTRSGRLALPDSGKQALAYSPKTFVDYLNRLAPDGIHFHLDDKASSAEHASDSRHIAVQFHKGISLDAHPLFFKNREEGTYAFWHRLSTDPPLPVWASHYLLLYLFSMLCRYETEWWGELVLSHTMAEIFLVDRFLTVHQEVFPAVIVEWLQTQTS